MRGQRHIKQVVYTGKNDGCSSRFKITNQGKKYLLRLRERFVRGQDLNLYYLPRRAELKDIDIQWWEQEKAIEQKHLDEVLANQKKPLSPEYMMNNTAAMPQKALPPKAITLDDLKRIIAEGNKV